MADLRIVGDRIEQLIDELRMTADPRVRDRVEEVLRLVIELYGEGLTRIVQVVDGRDEILLEELVSDDLVASLLLVHGLHPDDLTMRVNAALDSVRPLLANHGGDVELLEVDVAVGAVHLRLLGSCDGCPSSTITLQHAVEEAIVTAAPEIVTIDVDQPTAPPVVSNDVSVPISLGRKRVVEYDPATGCGAGPTVEVSATAIAAGGGR